MFKHTVIIERTKHVSTVTASDYNTDGIVNSGSRPVDHVFADNVEKSLRNSGYKYYGGTDNTFVLYEKGGENV